MMESEKLPYPGIIILAAGEGNRFGEAKQHVNFLGKEMWRHVHEKSISLLENTNICVVGVDCKGGETRSESVMIGLGEMHPKTTRVVIIEAARPLVTEEQIQKLLFDNHPSVSFVIPLVNSIISEDFQYINRNEHMQLQTPQGFNFPLLKAAYDSKLFPDMTDETRVMHEFHGIEPKLLQGGINLFKVAYREDLLIASVLSKGTEGMQ